MTLPDVLTLLAFAPAVTFVVVYAFQPWWANPVGRSTMTFAVVVVLALAPPMWRQLSDRPVPQVVRTVIFCLVIVALWAQLGVLVYVIRRKRRRVPPEYHPTAASQSSD